MSDQTPHVLRAQALVRELAFLLRGLSLAERDALAKEVREVFRAARQLGVDSSSGASPIEMRVTCPVCRMTLPEHRLDKHLRKAHPSSKTKGAPAFTDRGLSTVQSPSTGGSNGSKAPSATSTTEAKSHILCGDCGKWMMRDQYPNHECRSRGGGHFVLGGSPGLGRRK